MFRHAARAFSTSVNKTRGSSTGITGVDFVVAVSSAKGGVGKSTVAGNEYMSIIARRDNLSVLN